jgi:hypothetical protein
MLTDKERYLSVSGKLVNAKQRARYKTHCIIDFLAAVGFICCIPLLFILCILESFIPWSSTWIKDLWFLCTYKVRNK